VPALARLDEIPGVRPGTAQTILAQTILAQIGLDMGIFPTAAHLVAWAKLSPRTIQSGARSHASKTGHGTLYPKAALGEAAAAAARTNTFLDQRYRRLVKRRGKLKALVAIARSILMIIWHLLTDPTARFHDLGADYHINSDRKATNLRRQLHALGYTVTLQPAA
jgi:transposase